MSEKESHGRRIVISEEVIPNTGGRGVVFHTAFDNNAGTASSGRANSTGIKNISSESSTKVNADTDGNRRK